MQASTAHARVDPMPGLRTPEAFILECRESRSQRSTERTSRELPGLRHARFRPPGHRPFADPARATTPLRARSVWVRSGQSGARKTAASDTGLDAVRARLICRHREMWPGVRRAGLLKGRGERAAMIYQHEARGADATITNAIDAHIGADNARTTA